MHMIRVWFAGMILAGLPGWAFAQEFDLLIQGGRVIDPKNNLDGTRDVAIAQGKIARVAPSIPESAAKKVVRASGLIVTPGLIDMHAHVFYGTEANSYLSNGQAAVQPDGFCLRVGVTTAVD